MRRNRSIAKDSAGRVCEPGMELVPGAERGRDSLSRPAVGGRSVTGMAVGPRVRLLIYPSGDAACWDVGQEWEQS